MVLLLLSRLSDIRYVSLTYLSRSSEKLEQSLETNSGGHFDVTTPDLTVLNSERLCPRWKNKSKKEQAE